MRIPHVSRLVESDRGIAPYVTILIVSMGCVFFFTLGFERSYDDPAFFPKGASIDTQRSDSITVKEALTTDYWGVAEKWARVGNSPYYRPLSQAIIVIERRIFGQQVEVIRGLHTVLHLVNVLLVFAAALTIFRSQQLPLNLAQRAALIAAAWFGLSPVTADTVLFLSSVCDLLVLFFSLLSVIFFVKFLDRPTPARAGLSLLACAAAMACKESGYVLPLVFGGLLVIHSGAASQRQKWTGFVLSLFVVAAMLAIRFRVIGTHTGINVEDFLAELPVLIALALRFTVVPYPVQMEIEVPLPSFLWWAAAVAVVSAVTFLVFRFRKDLRLAGFGALGWALFLLPALSIAASRGIFAPRFLYVSYAFAALAIAPYLAFVSEGFVQRKALLWLGAALLFAGTVSRTMTWKDSLTLWAVEIGHNPDSLTAKINLSGILAERGHFAEAMVFADQAEATAAKTHQPCVGAMALINGAAILAERLHQPNKPCPD
jgi:hypothetical protein